MNKRIRRFFNLILIGLSTTGVSLFAQPVPQNLQELVQTQPTRTLESAQKPQPLAASPDRSELPDAPMPAQPGPQDQTAPPQTPNPGSTPSGAAAAKAAPAKGSPASRPVGAAIAPAKQRGHRSLLIKVGLVAGACVAIGSVVALSKTSSAKPTGAP